MENQQAQQDPERMEAATQRAETADDRVARFADRPPTEEEEKMAEEAAEDVDDEVGDHFQDMAERGAHVKGEGQIV